MTIVAAMAACFRWRWWEQYWWAKNSSHRRRRRWRIQDNDDVVACFRLSATAARDAAANFLFLRNECDRSPAEDEIRMTSLKTSIKSSHDVWMDRTMMTTNCGWTTSAVFYFSLFDGDGDDVDGCDIQNNNNVNCCDEYDDNDGGDSKGCSTGQVRFWLYRKNSEISMTMLNPRRCPRRCRSYDDRTRSRSSSQRRGLLHGPLRRLPREATGACCMESVDIGLYDLDDRYELVDRCRRSRQLRIRWRLREGNPSTQMVTSKVKSLVGWKTSKSTTSTTTATGTSTMGTTTATTTRNGNLVAAASTVTQAGRSEWHGRESLANVQ